MSAIQTPAGRQRAIELSTAALHGAQMDDGGRINLAMRSLNEELGGPGIMFALAGWCDTLALRQQAVTGSIGSDLVRPVWLDENGNVQTDPDDVPGPVRWAGRLIAARAALDKDTWDALIAAIPDGSVTEYVSVVLISVARTLNTLAGMQRGGDS